VLAATSAYYGLRFDKGAVRHLGTERPDDWSFGLSSAPEVSDGGADVGGIDTTRSFDEFAIARWTNSDERENTETGTWLGFISIAGRESNANQSALTLRHEIAGSWRIRSSRIESEGLKLHYRSLDWATIDKFMDSAPWLVSTLLVLPRAVASVFGNSAVIWLEVVSDPEGGVSQLVASIDADLPARDLLDRLRAVDEKWWRNVARETRGLLVLTA
jgi:hypothetical protein